VARNRSVDLKSEFFVDGSIAEDVVEDAGQSQGCCLASGGAVAVSQYYHLESLKIDKTHKNT
jgi:hypothetical protein